MPAASFHFVDLAFAPWYVYLVLFAILVWPTNWVIRTVLFFVTLRSVPARELWIPNGDDSTPKPHALRRWLRQFFATWFYAFLGAVGLAKPADSGPERLANKLYQEIVGAGPWLGVIERVIVLILSAVGNFQAVAFVMAAKGLIVQSIKATGAKAEDGKGLTPERMIEIKQETYLLGTFFSFAIAITGGVGVAEWATVCKEAETARRHEAAKSRMPNEEPIMQKERQTVLMDVDTGVDDALAIQLAIHSPDAIQLLGITTVSGNVSSAQAALNTLFLLKQFPDDAAIPVIVGAAKSLHGRVPTPVPHIHGSDGLGGVANAFWKAHPSDMPKKLDPDKAVDFILETSKRHGKKLTIVATGPLTNVALAIQKDPETMRGIGKIYAMGGALDTPGNITPFAEFNVHCDPKAYALVLRSGIPLTLFPLDVTEKVRLATDAIAARKDLSANERDLIEAIMKTYAAFHEEKYGFKGSFVHDALPVAALLDPSLFTFRTDEVVVEEAEPLHVGQTRWARSGEAGAKISVAITVKDAELLRLFWRQLHTGTEKCTFLK